MTEKEKALAKSISMRRAVMCFASHCFFQTKDNSIQQIQEAVGKFYSIYSVYSIAINIVVSYRFC